MKDKSNRKLPSYPIFVKDPFFSIWSGTDHPAKSNPVFWFEREISAVGYVLTGTKKYRWFGLGDGEELPLKDIRVTALKTIYEFSCEEFDMAVEFCSPLPLDNLQLLSMPVCYFTFALIGKGEEKTAKVTFSLSSDVCCSYDEKVGVRGDVYSHKGLSIGYMGLTNQRILSRGVDKFGADWGWWYLSGERCFYHDEEDLQRVIGGEMVLPTRKTCKKYLTVVEEKRIVEGKKEIGNVAIGFDDVASIYYYGEILRGLWFSEGRTINDAVAMVRTELPRLESVVDSFENKFEKTVSGEGENYRAVCTAAYRQSVGGHKIVRDGRGRLLFLSKENSSDGCIATVDISYPEMPLYLLFAPSLVQSMLYPIFDFAETDVWDKPFAPHDAGVYPYCNGQFYAMKNEKETNGEHLRDYATSDWDEALPMYWLYGKEDDIYEYSRQMPVEESANMLIISYLAAKYANDDSQLLQYFPLLKEWAEYLASKGLIPEKQLSTDDFAGHLDKSVNLAIKATLGLKAFAKICDRMGKREEGEKYLKEASAWAKEISALQSDALPISFGQEGNYSLKYNLATDRLLGEELFSKELKEKEAGRYLEQLNEYGCPLDSEHIWTKSDWLCWAASLSEDKAKREKMYRAIVNFLECSPRRVPFSDWYDADTGNLRTFFARTVQGGVFMPLLIDLAEE